MRRRQRIFAGLSVIGSLGIGSAGFAQESRPIADTIRVRPLETPAILLPSIEPPKLSGDPKRSDDIQLSLQPIATVEIPQVIRPVKSEQQASIEPPHIALPSEEERPPLKMPDLNGKPKAAETLPGQKADPQRIPVLKTVIVEPPSLQEPALLPNLEAPKLDVPTANAPARTSAREVNSFPELPPLDGPIQDRQDTRGGKKSSVILPVISEEKPTPKPGEPNLLLPLPETVAGPRAPKPQRKYFWEAGYDPLKDADPDACKECLVTIERGPKSKWWVGIEYLHWFMPRGQSPALLYGGFPSALSTPAAPQLGRAFPLYPLGPQNSRTTPGLRTSLGTWFEPNFHWGLEFTQLTVFDRGDTKSFASPGDLYLLRPFRDTNTGGDFFNRLAGPSSRSGTFRLETEQRFIGDEIHFLYDLGGYRNLPTSFILMAGYRHLEYRERISIWDQTALESRGIGTASNDHFSTDNEIHLAQIGLKASYQSSRWSIDLTSKISLGGTSQTANIFGSTIGIQSGVPTSFQPGGFLALPSNMGEYHRQRLVYAPELGLKLNYQLAASLTASIGYNFLYVSNVAKAGDLIDTTINPVLLPFANGGGGNALRPAFRWKDEELWAQGISLGLTLQY